MTSSAVHSFYARHAKPLALVLGTNEIASAAAVALHNARHAVVLCHDPFPPVIRRGMAFHDAIYGDLAVIEDIRGERADSLVEIVRVLTTPATVAVTTLSLTALIAMRRPDVLIDARMQKHRVTPDFRGIGRLTIGLGPNFMTASNCDIAIETHPSGTGGIVTQGSTRPADGHARELGGAARERFIYSSRAGLWHTAVDIGMRVFRGFVVGHLGGEAVHAAIDGTLRGIARDATQIPANVKIVEIDPRGRNGQWTGIDERGRAIAKAAVDAIENETVRHFVLETAGAHGLH